MALPVERWVAVRISHPEHIALDSWGRTDHDNEFKLVRGAPFTVLVLDPEAKPVAGAKVVAARTETQGVRGIWSWSDDQTLGEATTSEHGRAALGAVPATPFQLVVSHPAYARLVENVELRALKPVEHVVRVNEGGGVEGTVFGPDGEPLEGAVVRAGEREGTSGADGRFRIERVQIGFVTVSATAGELAPGFFGQKLGWDDPVPVEILGGEITGGLDIHLGRPTWVTGRGR